MGKDALLTLSIVVLVCGSGIYAVVASWWKRRHPSPVPYLSAARRAELDLTIAAERIVADAYARFGDLYDTPTHPAARP